MYAIVEIAGKQYKVRENDNLVVPRLSGDVDESVTFDRVLLVSDGDDVQLGTPVVDKASVTATIVEHFKGDKVLVFRKKRRKRFKVKRGHRQPYTRIEVSGLSVDGNGKASKKAQKSEDEAGGEKKDTKKASKGSAKKAAESKSSDKSKGSDKSKSSGKSKSSDTSKGSDKSKSSAKSKSSTESKSSAKSKDSSDGSKAKSAKKKDDSE